jgi:hypothetical protein
MKNTFYLPIHDTRVSDGVERVLRVLARGRDRGDDHGGVLVLEACAQQVCELALPVGQERGGATRACLASSLAPDAFFEGGERAVDLPHILTSHCHKH